MSAYREGAAFSQQELEDLATNLVPEARRLSALQDSAERVCNVAQGTLAVSLGVLALGIVTCNVAAALRFSAVATMAARVSVSALLAIAVQIAHGRWLNRRFEHARDIARAARSALHVARERARSAQQFSNDGGNGRCGCEDCERDPLGFFPPYLKKRGTDEGGEAAER